MSRFRSLFVAAAIVAPLAAPLAAQTPAPKAKSPADSAWTRRDGQGRRHAHGQRRGKGRMAKAGARRARGARALFAGVNLTDAQRTQARAIHDRYRLQFRALGDSLRPIARQAQDARRKGDTTAVKKFLASRQAAAQQVQAIRTREINELRGILTAEQRTRFDANVTRLQQRMAANRNGGRGGRGDFRGRGAGKGWRGRRPEA